ncbi:GGDEF domain-containing protein [Anaerotalea alkaliphila]|uniref:Diguanylate cyclase n=1 Tax=Anaerotalea alkaliphila TaxID=2662126 RepID=A0A7X5HUF0_9FIRM|nr:sensor domain-containing diguanylate cyclase [Anaerotalea alkaliphila]NDL66825.1 diguanylate cyclase [Anaerotalea alkaliphila]
MIFGKSEAVAWDANDCRILIENSMDMIYRLSEAGVIDFISPACTSLLGHLPEEMEGRPFESFVHPQDLAVWRTAFGSLEVEKVPVAGVLCRLLHKDGSWSHFTSNIVPLMDKTGRVTGSAGVARDSTEQVQKEKELLRLSFHDPVTGLYNRRFYEEEVRRLDTFRNMPITLLMADIDGLKRANDTYGHAMGDRLLEAFAEVLRQECREDDIIARIGGDEFVVLLPQTGVKEAEAIASRVVETTAGTVVDGIPLSVSIGWKTKLHENESMERIFKEAEDAMYRQKAEVRRR